MKGKIKRISNFPVEAIINLHKMLREDYNWCITNNPDMSAFTYIIYITNAVKLVKEKIKHKKKHNLSDLEFEKEEDKIIMENSEFNIVNAKKNTNEMTDNSSILYEIIIIISKDKYFSIIDKFGIPHIQK